MTSLNPSSVSSRLSRLLLDSSPASLSPSFHRLLPSPDQASRLLPPFYIHWMLLLCNGSKMKKKQLGDLIASSISRWCYCLRILISEFHKKSQMGPNAVSRRFTWSPKTVSCWFDPCSCRLQDFNKSGNNLFKTEASNTEPKRINCHLASLIGSPSPFFTVNT